ncbi:MAG: hypothetical protein PHV85_11015 [Desulfovibrionaceae bacterium]|nr:hypothetical protein [Desulfovibrionaceae bacterium]
MPLKDYQAIVSRLQQALGRAYAETPYILNVPGRSVACKLEPHYYLALQPAFCEALARWSGVMPATVVEALVKTGLIITRPPERRHLLDLEVSWGGESMKVGASFVDADFIDRALLLYGGLGHGLEVADLKIKASCRPRLEKFFENKDPLKDFVFEGP